MRRGTSRGSPRASGAGGAWLLKRQLCLAAVVAVPAALAVGLLRGWHHLAAFLNGGWAPWVSNVANVFQIVGPIGALVWWIARSTRARPTAHGKGAVVRVLRCFAWLLPSRDRERFVHEVVANMADRMRWWQRLEEVVSVAAAVPGLAVTLRWARRRRA